MLRGRQLIRRWTSQASEARRTSRKLVSSPSVRPSTHQSHDPDQPYARPGRLVEDSVKNNSVETFRSSPGRITALIIPVLLGLAGCLEIGRAACRERVCQYV